MSLRRTIAGLALVAAAAGPLAGCSTSPEAAGTGAGGAAASQQSPVTVMSMKHSTTNVGCPMHMPGELLSASEAIVTFDREHVCLGYVTVLEGTPIMWQNVDGRDHQVSIRNEDGKVVHVLDVPAASSLTMAVQTKGVYTFSTTAIDSFTGSIEVQAA